MNSIMIIIGLVIVLAWQLVIVNGIRVRGNNLLRAVERTHDNLLQAIGRLTNAITPKNASKEVSIVLFGVKGRGENVRPFVWGYKGIIQEYETKLVIKYHANMPLSRVSAVALKGSIVEALNANEDMCPLNSSLSGIGSPIVMFDCDTEIGSYITLTLKGE